MSILKPKQILEGVQDVCVRMKLENIEKIGWQFKIFWCEENL